MDVRMPDGTIIKNVPEGTTKAQLMAKRDRARNISALKQADPSEYDPSSPEYMAKYGATSGMSPWEKRVAGASSQVRGVGLGLKQTAADIASFVTGNEDSKATAERLRREADEKRHIDAELLSTREGQQGAIAGSLAATIPAMAIPGAQTVVGGAAVGGLIGASQPVGSGESRAENVGIGALLGGGTNAAIKGAGRLIRPIKSSPAGADARAVKTLEDAGVQLDAAQKSGSPAAMRVKSALRDNPVTIGGQVANAEKQQAQFNRAVLKSIGVNADVADEAVMGAAKDRISQAFNSVLSKHSVRFSASANNKAAAIEAQAKTLLGDNRIQNTIQRIRDSVAQNGGKLDGKAYQNIRSDLSALTGQKEIGPVARELMESLDDAFQQVAGPDAKLLVEARRQWRNMRIIENAIDAEGSGAISPSKLANQFNRKGNRNVGVYGKGDSSILDLAKLAKAGKRLLPDKLPQSGTTPRMIMQAALPAAAGGIYGGAKEGDLSGVATYGLAGLLAPKAIQAAINNPTSARYLTEGAMAGRSLPQWAASPLLTLRQAAPAGVPAYLLADPAK